MTQPPWVPGPGQKPPPLPEFQPQPKTKVFVPFKFKVWACVLAALGLLIWMSLLK